MGMPIIPDLNAFGAVPGERVFRDSLIAREASTPRTALAGGLAALILLGVPLAVLAGNALLGACGDLLRANVAAPLTALWDVAVGYVLAVGPWLLPTVVLGALLGWLRRYAARHDYILVLRLGPTRQMQFGLQSAHPRPARAGGPLGGCPAAGGHPAAQRHHDPAGCVSAMAPLRRRRGCGVGRRGGVAAPATVPAPAGAGDDGGGTHGAAGWSALWRRRRLGTWPPSPIRVPSISGGSSRMPSSNGGCSSSVRRWPA